MAKEMELLSAVIFIGIIVALIGGNYYRDSIQSERTLTTVNSFLVREDGATLGAADTPVTIVEFLDPECESCDAFNPIVKKMLRDYKGKVRLVVRYMPLHPSSELAATFTEAAGEEGKYWQAQELLFLRQSEWGEKHGQPTTTISKSEIKNLFEKYAIELGLDVGKIRSALAQNRFAAKIARDKKDGQSFGVKQTPTFFVNGRKLTRLDEADLRILIEEELEY